MYRLPGLRPSFTTTRQSQKRAPKQTVDIFYLDPIWGNEPPDTRQANEISGAFIDYVPHVPATYPAKELKLSNTYWTNALGENDEYQNRLGQAAHYPYTLSSGLITTDYCRLLTCPDFGQTPSFSHFNSGERVGSTMRDTWDEYRPPANHLNVVQPLNSQFYIKADFTGAS